MDYYYKMQLLFADPYNIVFSPMWLSIIDF